jgi:hypothetical protein
MTSIRISAQEWEKKLRELMAKIEGVINRCNKNESQPQMDAITWLTQKIFDPGHIFSNLSVVSPMQFAYGMLISGSRQIQMEEALNAWNFEVPPFNAIIVATKRVCDEILAMASESVAKALTKLPVGTVISFDGAYEHRRRAQRCFIAVFCQQTGQVIAFFIVTNRSNPGDPDYCAIPQNMEVFGMGKLVDILRSHPEICAYVHDNDAKTRKLIVNSKWGIVGSRPLNEVVSPCSKEMRIFDLSRDWIFD